MTTRKSESPATHLLISMLIRYPEISSIRYEPDHQAIIFSFFLQSNPDTNKQLECIQKLTTYFNACKELDRQFPNLGTLTFTPLEEITLVSYSQQISQVSTQEIYLLTSVLQEHFYSEVALEPLVINEDEIELQEELIDRLLCHRDILTEDKQIVAYREGGKVFVYNK